MEKILILGNDREARWLTNFPGVEIRPIDKFVENREEEQAKYIESLPSDLDAVVIDSDSASEIDTKVVIDLALRLRLDIFNLKKTALCKIVIVSNSSLETFRDRGVESTFLMTAGVFVSSGEEANLIVENNLPLTPAEYVLGFLNLIKIVPNEKIEGRHSIANEWGAEVLAKMVSGGIQDDIIKIKSSASLYFRYCRVAALNASDVSSIVAGKRFEHYGKELKIKETFNYLLIDDEAEKGWDKVLKLMMPNATPREYARKAEDYSSLPSELRAEIEACKFDVIFLDLRMMGVEEDRKQLRPEEFSGYKILKSIKEKNPGIQVIMLTATNKGWNVKALLDAGANGYYMKESPEYHFSEDYSLQNAISFEENIRYCNKRSYLMGIYRDIQNFKLDTDNYLDRAVYNQMEISFDLVNKASTPSEFAFAYISLEQVYEIIAQQLFKEKREEGNWTFGFENAEQYNLKDVNNHYFKLHNDVIRSTTPVWVKIATIYKILFEGVDTEFISNVKADIDLRNKYIHDNKKPKITEEDFLNLFDSIKELMAVYV